MKQSKVRRKIGPIRLYSLVFIRQLLPCFFGVLLYVNAPAQDTTAVFKPATADTIPTSNEVLNGASPDWEAQVLLPSKMALTQRVFWGPKGLLRITQVAPLTTESREREQKIRRAMLVSHQVMGYVTVAGYVVQGILAAKLYKATGNDYAQLRDAYQTATTVTNITYATTALLTLTAPPPLMAKRRSQNWIRLHKYLSIIHLTGMIATNVLAHQLDKNAELKPYHQTAAYATFGAFATSIIALRF